MAEPTEEQLAKAHELARDRHLPTTARRLSDGSLEVLLRGSWRRYRFIVNSRGWVIEESRGRAPLGVRAAHAVMLLGFTLLVVGFGGCGPAVKFTADGDEVRGDVVLLFLGAIIAGLILAHLAGRIETHVERAEERALQVERPPETGAWFSVADPGGQSASDERSRHGPWDELFRTDHDRDKSDGDSDGDWDSDGD